MTDQETDTDPSRAFARALFAPDEPDETAEPDEQPKPPIPNHVPKEGSNPQPPRDDGMRQFVADLFHATD